MIKRDKQKIKPKLVLMEKASKRHNANDVQKIYPGEEISENYYPVVHVMPRADRRAWLSEYYRYRRSADLSSTVLWSMLCHLQTGVPGSQNITGTRDQLI